MEQHQHQQQQQPYQERRRSRSQASASGSRRRSLSRQSSTGSSSLEVRCACQYYRSESLLPERSALAACRPQSRSTALRMVQTPPAGRKMPVACGDHEYEPIGTPALRLAICDQGSTTLNRLMAPVVKITDTDVMPVADSDDSIDDRYRFKHRALMLEGDVILPLDGRIEDSVMDGRNLGDQTIDNSVDELENTQDMQERLEARYLSASTPGGESRTDAEVHTSQVDSTMMEELPLRRGARGLQQRLKTQAGKIRSRFRNIQKPTFAMPRARSKSAEKPAVAKPPSSPRANQKASRMERFRMALPERPKFSLPDKSKFHLPDRSKFHLPERPKFNLPERPKFNLPERPKFSLPDKSKFHIKKPNIQLPKNFTLPRRSSSQRSPSREQSQTSNAESNVSSRRSIFDFSTYPRPKIFDRKSKAKTEYVTSSPKESRAQSTESSTFPRVKKASLSLSARWAQRFGETAKGFHDDTAVIDRSKPWRHPSLEEPRLSLKPQTSEEEEDKLPWENTERRTYDAEDEAVPDEEEERDISYGDRKIIKEPEISYDKEPVRDPKLEDEQLMNRIGGEEKKKRVTLVEEDDGSMIDPEAEDEHHTYHPGSFPPVDPRSFRGRIRPQSEELSEEEESMRSDKEIQQSSGSSCERRRRGVIEEIDSDEFFLREKGISQENMRYHLINEIRDALRPKTAQVDEAPPVRPKRTRSQRKRKEESLESFDATPPPDRPRRDQNALRRSQESFGPHQRSERASSLTTHRIVYQTESVATGTPQDRSEVASEPLDDIVVVKPVRRKSRSSLRSQSQSLLPPEEQNIMLVPMEAKEERRDIELQEIAPIERIPPVPCRRKRLRRDHQSSSLSIRTVDSALCNGFGDANSLPRSHERIPPTPPPTPPPHNEDRIRHIDDIDYIIPAVPPPVAPKRTRSHSRTASLAPEDDRTSHGADSLPGDFGYADDEMQSIPRDSTSREPSLPGYAVIEKRDKPPRPPPPRRKKQDKFATAPRPSKMDHKKPIRPYSTIRPTRSDTLRKSADSIPFMDADLSFEELDFHKDLRSGDILIKMQGRPLPAPPRPPRHKRSASMRSTLPRRSLPREITPDFSETVASTQTDPLPDDLVIEEEIMSAKLVVAPSSSGSSQVMISTERVPSPTAGSYKSVRSGTPPIPPLPGSGFRSEERLHDIDREIERRTYPFEESRRLDLAQLDALRAAIFSTDEPLRISSLEVGDLKVERLTVSQLEAYKVAASEIDAIVVSATELSNKSESEGGIHPSLLQELIAIRNQLEAVAASQPQSRPQSAMEDACTATSNERIDITLESDRRAFDRRSYTRESSPLLIVEPPMSEQVATVEMGRTVFPQSSSMTDLTSISDTTVSDNVTTIVVAESIEVPVPTITRESPALTSTVQPPTARSRSRSASPSRGSAHHPPGVVRQTASPVKSLPPVISVTPDIITETDNDRNDSMQAQRHVTSFSGVQPQRAVISYQTAVTSVNEDECKSSSLPPSRETSQSPPPPKESLATRQTSRTPSQPVTKTMNESARETSQSPKPPTVTVKYITTQSDQTQSQPQTQTQTEQKQQQPPVHTQFIAFPTSQIPPEFFSLANPPLSSSTTTTTQQSSREVDIEPSIADMASQLLRAIRLAGTRSLRHFVDSIVSRFPDAVDDEASGGAEGGALGEQKIRRVELAMCALLILIAGLIIVFICTPRTVTHHHHWDYFNPPQ